MVATGQRMKNRPIEGKPVVVTGASSGIGTHIARNLVAGGAQVTAGARRRDRPEDLAGELSSTGAISLVDGDVTEADGVERMVQYAVGRYGGIDALINNAISDDSRWVTGAVFDVDGGYSLGTPR